MIIASEFAPADVGPGKQTIEVELPYDLRKKSRLRAVSRCGREVGIQLPRGSELLDGQVLLGDDGTLVAIVASPETVSTVTADDALSLLRAAYHLGNRHMPLQISEQWLRYQHDHVLDDMVIGLGLKVAVESVPFQPESGAYHRGGGHSHEHSPNHSHDHHHDHDHGHHHHHEH